MPEKKRVKDMSGFCRHSGHHQFCRGQWETPSAVVMCPCQCHVEAARLAAIEAERHVKRTIKVQPPRPIKRRLKPKK